MWKSSWKCQRYELAARTVKKRWIYQTPGVCTWVHISAHLPFLDNWAVGGCTTRVCDIWPMWCQTFQTAEHRSALADTELMAWWMVTESWFFCMNNLFMATILKLNGLESNLWPLYTQCLIHSTDVCSTNALFKLTLELQHRKLRDGRVCVCHGRSDSVGDCSPA